MSREHDVKTDKFTELAEYFYGFDKLVDVLQFFEYHIKMKEEERDYYIVLSLARKSRRRKY